MKKFYPAIIFISFLCTCFCLRAGAQTIDYSVHANIIFHFTKYVDWPNDKKVGDFVIGIVGDSPLYDELKNTISTKSSGRQKIVIRKFSSTENSYNCHILFISEDESNSLKKIALQTAGLPILIITETEHSSAKGFCINFIIVNDRLTLEFNKSNIEKRNLKVASDLLSLGTTIQ